MQTQLCFMFNTLAICKRLFPNPHLMIQGKELMGAALSCPCHCWCPPLVSVSGSGWGGGGMTSSDMQLTTLGSSNTCLTRRALGKGTRVGVGGGQWGARGKARGAAHKTGKISVHGFGFTKSTKTTQAKVVPLGQQATKYNPPNKQMQNYVQSDK